MKKIYYIKTDEQDNTYQAQHEAGRLLLARALEEAFGIKWSLQELDQEIVASDRGKPYLKNYPKLHFNISHCKGWIACAVSDAPIGIDIERIREFRTSMIRKLLSEEEKQYMKEYENDENLYRQIFFCFWTLKEAYLKWKGTGFFENPRKATFTFDVNGTILCSDENVQCEQKILEDDCIMAVVEEKINYLE